MVLNEGASKYKHPGGHINLRESLLDGLKRELKEEIGLEIEDADSEKIFFDVVFKDGNAMINSLFQIQIDLETAEEIISKSPLPTKLFKLDDLNEQNTWESEINAIKYYEEENNIIDHNEINKQNLPKWINTLRYLTKILKENDIRYYLSASGLGYILGSKKYPYDIDLFVSRKDVGKALELLRPLSISEIHEWNYRYVEFQGECNDIPFEICEWEEEPNKIIEKKFKDFEVSIIEEYLYPLDHSFGYHSIPSATLNFPLPFPL